MPLPFLTTGSTSPTLREEKMKQRSWGSLENFRPKKKKKKEEEEGIGPFERLFSYGGSRGSDFTGK